MDEVKPTIDLRGEEPPAVSAPIFRRRGARSKANIKKKPASPTGSDQSDSSTFSDDENETLSSARAKRRKYGTISAASKTDKVQSQDQSSATVHTDRDFPLTDTNDATKRRDWYDKPSKTGPMPSSNVRVTTIMDFKPDVCKDYQRTGWCGFGDACVFAHDRSVVKQGWELDKEWEDIAKRKGALTGTIVASASRENASRGGDIEDDDAGMLQSSPSACIICEKSYKAPVMTQCRHYFCETCALTRYKKDPTCAACGADTKGIFNSASRLERLLRRKKAENDDAQKND